MNKPIFIIVIVLCAEFYQIHSQFNGNFWWQNEKLIDSARESRKNNNVKAIIENSLTINRNVVNRNFKEDNLPDCVCVADYKCSKDNYYIGNNKELLATASTRSGICGANEICCRIRPATDAEIISFEPFTTIRPTVTAPTTVSPNEDAVLLENLLDLQLEDVKKCGQRGGERTNSGITFGDPYDKLSDFGEFPWMVALFHKQPGTNRLAFKCGAALLSPFVAVTVAHCLSADKNNPQNFVIQAGDWDINSKLEYIGHQSRTVKKFKRHPNFYSGNLFNDLSLLVWNTPLDMSKPNIGTVCLPEGNENFDGKKCLVTGWNNIETESNVLKYNDLIAKNQNECEENIQKYALGKRFKLHQSFVCADGAHGQHVCKLHAGSPMVCEGNDFSYVLTGLFSWRVKCEDQIPSVYTNIPHFTNWLQDEMENLDIHNINLNVTNSL